MDTNISAAPSVVMHTVGEAAARAKISKRYLEMRIADGTGPDVTRIGRRILIRDDRLTAWIEHLTEGQGPQMGRDQQTDAALRVLAAVRARNEDDPQGVVRALRGSAAEVSVRLMEAVEIIAHMCRLSDQPELTLIGLIESVTPRD